MICIIIQRLKKVAQMSLKQHNQFICSHTGLFLIIFFCLLKVSITQITIADTHIQTTRNAYRSAICSFYNANFTSS